MHTPDIRKPAPALVAVTLTDDMARELLDEVESVIAFSNTHLPRLNIVRNILAFKIAELDE